jgi:2-polyprenyl-6-methoxyphenol hydroxylase-like FAD-dependent oxidoreductase
MSHRAGNTACKDWPMTTANDADVLIVGAGPTGLMLANQLARRGVRVLIIDRHAGPSRETRALGVQARTLEIYSGLGIADRAIELGKPGTGANLWARGRKLARVPLGEAGADVSAYPYILVLGQDDNERLMGERLRELGVSVQWNTELVKLHQHPDRVIATLKASNGTTRTVSVAWVGGCDGAHSSVRELCGITFPGAPYEHVFFVADVEATGQMVPDEVNVYLWREGFHLFFPMRGQDHWRIVGILPVGLRNRPDLRFEQALPSVQGELGASLHVRSCTWFSTYRIHHRAASRFRSGRCFLLGDAAHIHSPMGAQGMNTGLQDAYNLAWKLALVIKGICSEELLDSYERERIPVARALLHSTDRAFRLVVADNWLAGLFRTQVLARLAKFVMNRKRIQRAAFLVVSQTGIRYRRSALSESLPGLPENAPRAGDRFPWMKLRLKAGAPQQDSIRDLDNLGFNLLLFGQSAPELPQLNDVPLHMHEVPSDPGNEQEMLRAKIPRTSFYLVRPDGYIALCGQKLTSTALAQYFATRVHTNAALVRARPQCPA